MTVTSADGEAIVGGPNRKNIRNLRVNTNSGMQMSESLSRIQASPDAQVSSDGVGESCLQEPEDSSHVSPTNTKELKAGVNGGDEGNGDPGARIAVVPSHLVDSQDTMFMTI